MISSVVASSLMLAATVLDGLVGFEILPLAVCSDEVFGLTPTAAVLVGLAGFEVFSLAWYLDEVRNLTFAAAVLAGSEVLSLA